MFVAPWRVVLAAAAVLTLVGCSDRGGEPEPSGTPQNPAIVRDIPESKVRAMLPLEDEDADAATSAWYADLKAAATALTWQDVRVGNLVVSAACTGTGTPTVVYLDGWRGSAAFSWSRTMREQATRNRVCAFDRPGTGMSPPRSAKSVTVTTLMHADEATALMGALGEPGPYLLVGWSYGGLAAQTISAVAPDEVAGLVLVDSSSPRQDGMDRPFYGEGGQTDASGAVEEIGQGPDLGTKPVVVLEAGKFDSAAPEGFEQEWDQLQSDLATISTNSVRATVDESDHAIPINNPEVVVAATDAASDSIRSGDPMPTCPPGIEAAGATCLGAE